MDEMDDTWRDDDIYARTAAAHLRGPESVDDTFTARVMAVVRTEARSAPSAGHAHPRRTAEAGSRGMHQPASAPREWWRRSITLRVTPIGAFAVAAGIAAVVALSQTALAKHRTVPPAPITSVATTSAVAATRTVAQHDTTYIVRFIFLAPSARSVALVGDFNNWNRHATPLRASGEGAWTVSVPLQPGKHEYAFVLDGQHWSADPHAAFKVADDFGTESSIVAVGASGTSPII